MIMDAFYAHRVYMIERSLPATASLYHSNLLKIIRNDVCLRYSEKQAIRIYADLALKSARGRYSQQSPKGSPKQAVKPTLWQRLRAWAVR